MNNLHDTEWRRLADYLAGELPSDDMAAVQAWLDREPRRRALLERLRAAWDEAGATRQAPVDVEHLLGTVRTRIAAETTPPRAPHLASRVGPHVATSRTQVWTRISRSRWAIGAAAAAFIVGIAGVWRVRHNVSSTSTPYALYRTGAGQIAHLTLADGSRLTLAPNSRLGVARDFGHRRDVTLSGEAYFQVAPGTTTPFLVHTGNVTTRVLGTAFDVQRYTHDTMVRVTVASGKVMVAGPAGRQAPVTLTAGMTGMVGDSSAVTMATDELPSVRWIDGQLMFHKAPTADVLAALARWYGYQFRLADSSLAAKNLTLVLSTESSSAALSTLKLMLDVDLIFDDSVVTLSPKHNPHPGPRATRTLREALSTPQLEVGR